MSGGTKRRRREKRDIPPSFLSANAVHLDDSRGEETAEGSRKTGGGEEEGDASLEFLAAVEHRPARETQSVQGERV